MDVSLVFGMIFTLIVIGLLLVFGWEQIAGILGFSAEAQVLKNIDNLKNKVDDTYRLGEGSSEQFTLSFPKDYSLCFFNSSNPADRFYSDKSVTWDPDSTVKYLINASHYNVWYYAGSDSAAGKGKRIPYLEMPTENNFCATGGKKVYIVKKYDWVEIEPF
jgi:hypothetical protein